MFYFSFFLSIYYSLYRCPYLILKVSFITTFPLSFSRLNSYIFLIVVPPLLSSSISLLPFLALVLSFFLSLSPVCPFLILRISLFSTIIPSWVLRISHFIFSIYFFHFFPFIFVSALSYMVLWILPIGIVLSLFCPSLAYFFFSRLFSFPCFAFSFFYFLSLAFSFSSFTNSIFFFSIALFFFIRFLFFLTFTSSFSFRSLELFLKSLFVSPLLGSPALPFLYLFSRPYPGSSLSVRRPIWLSNSLLCRFFSFLPFFSYFRCLSLSLSCPVSSSPSFLFPLFLSLSIPPSSSPSTFHCHINHSIFILQIHINEL